MSGSLRLIGYSQSLFEQWYKASHDEQEGSGDSKCEDPYSDIHGRFFFGKLDTFLKDDKLCDITVKIGGRSFRTHKLILSVASEYFETMFSGAFVESRKPELEIEGDGEAFNKLLTFAYTGRLVLPGNNKVEVLKLACYMQFTTALPEVATLLIDELNEGKLCTEDVFAIVVIAQSHGKPLGELLTLALSLLAVDFPKFMETDAFVEELGDDMFETILKKPELAACSTEKQLLDGVIKWLSADVTKRRDRATKLLKSIYLQGIAEEHLKEALFFFRTNKMADCKKMIEDVLRTKRKVTKLSKQETCTSPRSVITAPLVLGGAGDNTVMYFDKDQCCWVTPAPWKFAPVPTSTRKLTSPGVIVVNDELYVAGGCFKYQEEDENLLTGRGRSEITSAVYKYQPVSNSWKRLSNMCSSRSHFAMAYLPLDEEDHSIVSMGVIYAIGGKSGYGTPCRNVEGYDTLFDLWESKPRLLHYYINPSAVARYERIFVYGNCTIFGETTNIYCLEMYDPWKEEWSVMLQNNHNCPSFREVLLTVHEEKCYQISFEAQNEDDQVYGKVRVTPIVITERRLRGFDRDRIAVEIGEDEVQVDLKCNNAFCMNSSVFVLLNSRFVLDTGIKVSEIGPDGLDKKWDNIYMGLLEGMTMFTFDILKLQKNWRNSSIV